MAIKKSPAVIEAAAKRSRVSMLEAASHKRRALPSMAGPIATRKADVGEAAPGAKAGFAFIAYAREDDEAATAVVAALRAHGIVVRWDRDLLGGQHFRQRLSEMVSEAAAVLVLWSEHSVGSDFVIDEAEAGKRGSKLVTCHLGDLGAREIPFGFRQLHCVESRDTDAILAALAALGLEPTDVP